MIQYRHANHAMDIINLQVSYRYHGIQDGLHTELTHTHTLYTVRTSNMQEFIRLILENQPLFLQILRLK